VVGRGPFEGGGSALSKIPKGWSASCRSSARRKLRKRRPPRGGGKEVGRDGSFRGTGCSVSSKEQVLTAQRGHGYEVQKVNQWREGRFNFQQPDTELWSEL